MGFFDGANLHRPSDGARVSSTMDSHWACFGFLIEALRRVLFRRLEI